MRVGSPLPCCSRAVWYFVLIFKVVLQNEGQMVLKNRAVFTEHVMRLS